MRSTAFGAAPASTSARSERTGGHAYGSVYPGPIGAILSPQLTGIEDNAPALRILAVRRLLRRLPGQDQHPEILVHLRAKHTETYASEHRLPSAEASAMTLPPG